LRMRLVEGQLAGMRYVRTAAVALRLVEGRLAGMRYVRMAAVALRLVEGQLAGDAVRWNGGG